ncbi:MAG TPA: sigma-54 dependent transcriptional regulator [Longimicrobiales bacterium]
MTTPEPPLRPRAAREREATSTRSAPPGADDDPAVALPIPPEVKSRFRVLIVDPDPAQCEACARVLEADGYRVSTCSRGPEAEAHLRRSALDIVLLDLQIQQAAGLELLRECLRANPDAAVITTSGVPSVHTSMEALRAGAWEYLPKPFSAVHLQLLIEQATYRLLQKRRATNARAELETRHSHSSKMTLLGVSPAFAAVVELARKVAPTDASVFISGESGTGKEMIAQFIHKHSKRARKPFVAVNCAALPESLLESEMFGYRKGAFTGAVHDKPGLLEAAHGGTLFLDELSEMAPSLQAKLLRVIQDGVVRRVGSAKTDTIVDARFISATNRDPLAAIADGALRSDLYYRLRVVPIRVPPLRERPEDIPVLARHFLLCNWTRHRGPGAPPPVLTDDAMRALQSRPWPGNVRELQNVIEHAAVLVEPGSRILPEQLPSLDDAGQGAEFTFASALAAFAGQEYHTARNRVIAHFERGYLQWLVREADGNMSEAARIAGVDRTTLYRLMEKHELDRGRLSRGNRAA